MFSIVMPLFNKRGRVAAAVESVLSQRHDQWELIIVDDGSTDGSTAELAAVNDPRVTIFRQENQGDCAARNSGLARSRGDWIAFLDADDLWLPCHLDELDALSRQFPDAGLIGTACIDSDGAGRFTVPPERPDPRRSAIDYIDAIGRNGKPFYTSSAAISRRIYRQLGGFGAFPYGGDEEYWARIALLHPVAASERTTVVYIHGTGGMVDSNRHRWSGISRLEDVMPATAMLVGHCDRPLPHRLRRSIERYVERDLGWCLKTLVANRDIATIRSLPRLYRRFPPAEQAVLILISYLPRACALGVYRFGFRIKAILRALRLIRPAT